MITQMKIMNLNNNKLSMYNNKNYVLKCINETWYVVFL